MLPPNPPARPPLRRRLAPFGALALCIGTACTPSDDTGNRALLETLPLDRRNDLLEDLHRFDALSPTEQTAIRGLDASLAALKPDEQARLRALLQHYHVWFQGLTDEQRAKLAATTDPEERTRIAQQLRGTGTAQAKHLGTRIARLRPGFFGLAQSFDTVGPIEMARLLQVWFALSPERRLALDAKPTWIAIRDDLRSEARSQPRIRVEPIPDDQIKQLDAQLEAETEFRPLIESRANRVQQATSKGNLDAARRVGNAQRKFEQAFAEFLYFEEHPPRSVAPDRLARFADSCPEWLRTKTDSLASDDARAYYTLLYRQIYPGTREMPDPAPVKSVPGRGATSKTAPANPVF